MHSALAGFAGGLIAVAIWSCWIVATRYAVTTSIDPISINLLRLSVPALVFLPLIYKRGFLPRGVPLIPFFITVIGAGAPSSLLVSGGLQFAPISHMVILTPGSVPFYVAFLGLIILGLRPNQTQTVGIILILIGIIGLGGWTIIFAEGDEWQGDLLFVAAAIMWSCYSLAFPKTGLTPLEAAGYIGLWGLLFVGALVLWSGVDSLVTASWSDIILQIIVQGLLSSIVAIVAYGIAIRNLGPQQAAAFTSLVPVTAVLLAIPTLGENPNIYGWVALVAMSFGVLLTTGAIFGKADVDPDTQETQK